MTPTQIYDELARSGMTLRQAVNFTDQLRDRVVVRKQAMLGDIMKALTGGVGLVKDLGGLTAPIAQAAIVAPPVLGYLAGDMLARGMDVDSTNVADIQEQELVAELAANAEAIRRRQRLRESGAQKS